MWQLPQAETSPTMISGWWMQCDMDVANRGELKCSPLFFLSFQD
jgi:hypothetical protein